MPELGTRNPSIGQGAHTNRRWGGFARYLLEHFQRRYGLYERQGWRKRKVCPTTSHTVSASDVSKTLGGLRGAADTPRAGDLVRGRDQ